ncbi:hypothetical protein [Mycolicibacterium aubagnense]|uniref:Uncharacterized protein n=1 Tax=Mycolicibacterium aubagnense TaxID=319707 RepID=A0ABM7IJY4_9MYCO|nr:hypothetical protein [Mycolicibacterium aubagnense]TLH58188.1 hypothetical protein C1S80_21270 [Mycolicibacterium aubagnense]WGI31605.1 hypothetical protein QDT91_20580 [Mycolicibacterium aubagnense]BBX86933.1 hypothetical protein MAUB_48060 [Mycolicibacterium aubagnense]
MTVGEYAGVALQDDADTWRAGGVFLLRHPAARNAVVKLNGWTSSVVAGSKAVVTTGPSTAVNHTGAFLAALLAANQGLDYMSATGQTHSAIADTADDSIVWWPDGGGGAAMRATFIVGQGFDATATATVTDASGNVRVRGAGQTRLQVVTTVVGSTNLDAPSAAFFVQSAINVYCTRKPSLTRWV